MKKYLFTIIALVAMVLTASATDLTGKRIYLNPGHGSFGPNDRPMATIPYPNLASTGMPDTCGFYESNTNLWKCEYLRDRLRAAGATVVMSREACGPWPYEKVDGQYPGYSWSDYQNRPDYEMYNKPLSVISEEAESGNYDLFLSVHSNAITDGGTTNYPLFLYRGYDAATSQFEQTSKAFGQTLWPYRFDMFDAGYEPASYYSKTQPNVRGDVDFMGSGSWSTRTSGNSYYGYYGVLKHGVPGGLCEGYFHTYQPGRHRALNHDHCHMEGISYYRAMLAWFNADPDPLGYICGTVKDMDNKMTHGLYKYAARTNDQWVPCNGATVYLLNAAGDTLQSYQVDSFYNGTFVFYDLQPGTYHLTASCEGYYDLDAEQRAADVVVTANTTTFPFLYLRDTTWAPPAVVYENYPDKSSGVSGLDGQYNFSNPTEVDFSAVVAGKTVRQVLVRDDQNTYVLALDTTAKTSHIYHINTLTGALIENVSTEGVTGETYPIYNLAFTADSVLMGASYGMNEFDDSRVPAGRTRGTWGVYYWNMDSLMKAPKSFVSSQLSGNFYTAWVGESFAVSGTLGNATVYTDALTTGMSNIRVMQFVVDSFSLVSACRNQEGGELTIGKYGRQYSQIASPVADDRTALLGAIKGVEYGWGADAGVPQYGFTMPACNGGQAFMYGGQAVVAAPVMGAAGQIETVNLYNLTAGRSALGVTTTNIATNLVASYCSVKPLANGKDIVLYVATEDHIYRYTTAGVAQPSFRNIYAYDLKAIRNADSYDLTFSFNTQPTEATIHIFSEEGLEVKTIPVTAPQTTGNVVNLPMPIEGLDADQAYRWEVEAAAPEVGNWAIAEQKSAASMGMTRVFNAVNVYPETEHFGTIYLMDRKNANDPASGLYVMNPDLTLQNTTAYKGQQSMYGSPYRFGIASDGTVFVGDWADPHSGVYVVDPENPSGSHTNFFAGTQNTSGLWKNASGVEEGSSTPSVYVYGTGADSKLLVYNEDPGTTLPTNGLCVYNIGQPDGSVLRFWDGAPSAKMNFEGQANTNGNVWGCSKGVWVSQHRSAGNNNNSATSLRFYSWDGHCTFASHLEPTFPDGTLVIDGSLGSCFALSNDESFLALRGTDKNIQLFDVTWNDSTPTLTYKGDFKNELAGDFDLLQMNWDYAGNLIATGNAGLLVIAVPKEDNRCKTPASEANKIVNGEMPFDHCLYDPAEATLTSWFTTTSWVEETNSTATLDSLGNIQVNIVDPKNARWQAQVKLNTGLTLDENKLYSLAFTMKASANLSGVTARMFENPIMMTDSSIVLTANQEVAIVIDSIPGLSDETSGVLVFDFGFASANTSIYISDIAICEIGDKPRVIYEHLYEIGDNQGWKPAEAVEMTSTAENIFSGVFTFSDASKTYFSFITVKDADWNIVNEHRFGPFNSDQEVQPGDVIMYPNANAFRLNAAGTYTFTVDLNTMMLNIHKEESALDNISDDSKAVKFIRNGQLLIRKDGHIYTTAGMLVE